MQRAVYAPLPPIPHTHVLPRATEPTQAGVAVKLLQHPVWPKLARYARNADLTRGERYKTFIEDDIRYCATYVATQSGEVSSGRLAPACWWVHLA